MKRAGVVALFALAALSAGACHKKQGKPKSAQTTACEEAVKHASDVHAPAIPSDPKFAEYGKKLAEAANGVLLTRCKADHWSKAALDCFTAAKKDEDLDECMEHMTSQQSMAVQMGIQQAAEKLGPAPSATATTSVAQESPADAILHITQLKDEMCKCPDATCAEAVDAKWNEEEKRSETARLQEDVSDQWQNIDDDYVTCHQKFPVIPGGSAAPK